MTLTFGNPAVYSPGGCNHWRLDFSITTQAGTKVFSERITRQEVQNPDPGDSVGDAALFVAIIEARRIAKAAGATTLAQANAAIRNQVVVI
jgi:hypothetical protein